MSDITIDELNHENSLIRARNDRLEAEIAETVKSLSYLRDVAYANEWRDLPMIHMQLGIIVAKLGSAT